MPTIAPERHSAATGAPAPAVSGRELILEVEDLYNRLSDATIQRSPFWRAMIETPETAPEAVFHGLCIENYHLLFRESFFDSPVLSYPGSREARLRMNEFYRQEIGHDELLLQSLQSIGLDRDSLFRSVPLPETAALYNALAYWARYDPLFFFTTLGPLEGRDVEIDSFVVACRRRNLPAAFVDPIHTHANINKNAEHGLLAREIFETLPVISLADRERVLRLTGLFVAIYDRFFTGVWRHYGGGGALARRIDDI